jgi:hypothetical protein
MAGDEVKAGIGLVVPLMGVGLPFSRLFLAT